MILPIYLYGHPVLKKECTDIDRDYPELEELIENMWETMYHAKGVGLAAPQVGHPIRLFLVDTIQVMEEGQESEGIKKVFINAEKIGETGDPWTYEEGCLSIPGVHGDVDRPPTVTLRYLDADFKEHTETFEGVNARVIQHEYDHIDGILFTELLKPIRKRRIRRKLEEIRKGKSPAEYPTRFAR